MLTPPYAGNICYAHPLALGHPFSATGRPHFPDEKLMKMLSSSIGIAMYQVGFLAVLDLLLKHMTSFSVYSSSYTIHR